MHHVGLLGPGLCLAPLSKCLCGLKLLEADQAAADREQRLVDVGAALVAHAQASVLVKPGDRALDHPAAAAETRAVPVLGPGHPGLDPPAAQRPAHLARVVSAVAVDASGA